MATLSDFDIISIALESEAEAQKQNDKVEEAVGAVADALLELDSLLETEGLDGETKAKVEELADSIEARFEKLTGTSLKASNESQGLLSVGLEENLVSRGAKALWEMITRAYEFIKKHATNLLMGIKKLFSRADKVGQKVKEKMPDNPKDEVTVTNGDLAAKIREAVNAGGDDKQAAVNCLFETMIKTALETDEAAAKMKRLVLIGDAYQVKPEAVFRVSSGLVDQIAYILDRELAQVKLAVKSAEDAKIEKVRKDIYFSLLGAVREHCEEIDGVYYAPWGCVSFHPKENVGVIALEDHFANPAHDNDRGQSRSARNMKNLVEFFCKTNKGENVLAVIDALAGHGSIKDKVVKTINSATATATKVKEEAEKFRSSGEPQSAAASSLIKLMLAYCKDTLTACRSLTQSVASFLDVTDWLYSQFKPIEKA